MYVDFDYYRNTYGGSAITERAAFVAAERFARRMVDLYTFGRLVARATQTESVRECICELAEAHHKREAALENGREVQSVSNDGVSVTYSDLGEAAFNTRCGEIIRAHLAASGLLYRGVE